MDPLTLDERMKYREAQQGKKGEHRIRVTVRTETTYWFPYDDDNPDVDPRYEDITNADLDGFVLEHFNAEMPGDVLRSSESVILHGPSNRGLMSNAYEPFDPGFIIAPEDVRRWKERHNRKEA